MSRFSLKLPKEKKGYSIAYGFDRTTGYFFQVFGKDEDGIDELLIDECSMFSGLSHGRMLELMTEYGCENENHKTNVALDLPF